jgi:hypothetical protein
MLCVVAVAGFAWVPLFRLYVITTLSGCKNMLYYFFWGDSVASEFYVPTFRNTLFHVIGGVRRKNEGDEIGKVLVKVKVWLKIV